MNRSNANTLRLTTLFVLLGVACHVGTPSSDRSAPADTTNDAALVELTATSVQLDQGITATFTPAQEDTASTVEIGDRVELTLAPNSETRIYLDLEIGQSILLTSVSDLDWSLGMVDSLDEPAMGSYSVDLARLVATSTDTYEITLENRNDFAGEVILTISDVEVHEIEIGESVTYEAGDLPIFEVLFTGEAERSILIESSQSQVQYTLERLHDDGSVTSILSSGWNLDPITGVELPGDAQYRIVTEYFGNTEMPEDGYIEVRHPDMLTGNLIMGSIVEDTATAQLTQYTIELEADQQLYATVLSDLGSQLYISDSDNVLLEYFGHALVPHEFAHLEFTAPRTDTYSLQIIYPPMGNLYNGNFALVVGSQPVLRLEDGPFAIDLTSEEPSVFSTRLREGQQYRLMITSESKDAITGAIQVELFELPHATLLDEEIGAFGTADFTFEAQNSTGAVLIITSSVDVRITIHLEKLP